MRVRSSRAALAVLTLLLPGAGATFVACSSSGGSGGGDGGGSDATEAATKTETGAPEAGDSSVTHDAAPSDGDAGTDAAPDADASDAGLDTGLYTEPDAYPDGSGFAGDCGIGPSGEPIELRCTGLYSDWASKTVSPDVQPYDPGLHLWSDGADKKRWIHLPAGQTIDTTDMDEWTFPVGTKVFKEFSLPLGDASTPTRIETRLLWKQDATTWYRTTYRWSDDGVSSTSELTDGQLDAGGTSYEVPSQEECRECHSGRKDDVLGFEAVSLASPGASGLTLQALTTQHLLTAPPAGPLTIPGDAVESTALAYLHANCGTACHNRGNGAAMFSGFFMRLDVATLATVQTTDVYTTGWNQPTSSFFIEDASTSYRIHACDLPSSCAYVRPSSRDQGTQMPPIDTHVVDDAGLSAIAAWIDEGCDAGHD
jgi:hypothetical protein